MVGEANSHHKAFFKTPTKFTQKTNAHFVFHDKQKVYIPWTVTSFYRK